MRADMRSKVDFLYLIDTQDEYGESSKTWDTFKTSVWASKEQLLGKEFFGAEQFDTLVDIKFRTYWFDGVQNNMRIAHGSEIYEIISAINVKSLNRELLIYARRVE
jgi:SPP1 family predicted phage head-tail adaptor